MLLQARHQRLIARAAAADKHFLRAAAPTADRCRRRYGSQFEQCRLHVLRAFVAPKPGFQPGAVELVAAAAFWRVGGKEGVGQQVLQQAQLLPGEQGVLQQLGLRRSRPPEPPPPKLLSLLAPVLWLLPVHAAAQLRLPGRPRPPGSP